MRTLRTASVSILSSVALFGCTALLGTFDVSTTSGGGGDGGDGGGNDGAGDVTTTDSPVDAPVEAEAPLLKCALSGGNSPRAIDVAFLRAGTPPEQNPQFDRNLQVYHLGDKQVRVVARPSQSTGFSVYDFDPSSGGGAYVVPMDVPTGNGFLSSHKTLGTISVLATGPNDQAAPNWGPGRIDLHPIKDTSLVDAITFLSVPGVVPTNWSGNTSADFLQIGPGPMADFFFVYSSAVSSPGGPFEMRVGRAKYGVQPAAADVQVFYSTNDQANPATASGLFRAKGRVYMPLRDNTNGPPTDSTRMIDSDELAPQAQPAPVPRSLAPSGANPKPNIFAVGGDSKAVSGAYNMAFYEIDINSTTAPISFRLGAIDGSKLGVFHANDIPVAFTFDTISRFPSDGGGARWEGDEFLATGRGPGGTSGLNFIWYDLTSKVLRANATGPDSLLRNRGAVNASSIAFAGAPLPVFARFDLVWTESTAAADGGTTETLFYQEVTCIH